jgi:Protein of unknown function (DUF2934)
MSSKPREHRKVELHAMSATQADAAETKAADSARHQEIRIRAYQIYLERGDQPGRDLDDWLQAERELTTNHTGE